jgi:hypothetical protein
MLTTFWNLLQKLFITPYQPQPDEQGFLARAETKEQAGVTVAAAIVEASEGHRLFGMNLCSRGLQPVFLRIRNAGTETLRLQFREIDPRYYTPLEAAARCHFSILRRLSTYGIVGWMFAPLLLLIPLKLLTAYWANLRIDELFQAKGFHRRPIAPGQTVEGFVFTTLDAGTKIVRVYLTAIDRAGTNRVAHEHSVTPGPSPHPEVSPTERDIDLTFSLTVQNLFVDYEHRQLAERAKTSEFEDCHVAQLVDRLQSIPGVTTNQAANGTGDPVNLVLIGTFENLLVAFVGRWDETEAITLSSCWKTVRAFLLGSEYRYSPVSSLYLLGRGQDIALQQIRNSINVRLHLRLWLAPYRLDGQPVWVGQISRDIGVRFTTKTWNLTTHRIDPDVDEARDYVLDDLLDAERVEAAAFVEANTACTPEAPRRNLTSDPYYTHPNLNPRD